MINKTILKKKNGKEIKTKKKIVVKNNIIIIKQMI